MSKIKTKYNIHQRICQNCNVEYWAQKKDSKFCNKSCATGWRNVNNLEINAKIGRGLKNSKKAKIAREIYSHSEEANKKRSETVKIQWKNVETRTKMINNQKQSYINNPEIVKDRMIKISQNVNWRLNLSKSMRFRWKNNYSEMFEKCIRPTLNIKKSNEEQKFEDYLIFNNINYTSQYRVENKCYDFYLSDLNTLVEIDGEYWHPTKSVKDIHLKPLLNLSNDQEKNQIAIKNNFSLYRIQDFPENFLNISFKDFSYSYYDYITKENNLFKIQWDFEQPLISRERLVFLNNKQKLKYAHAIIKFLRTNEILFEDLFPQFDKTKINLLVQRIKNRQYKFVDNTYELFFVNFNELKLYFNNIYDVVNQYSNVSKNSKDIYNDDKLLLNVIKYRCGLNKSKKHQYKIQNSIVETQETFQITKSDILNGINSYYRSTPSLFSPQLAYQIYKNNCKENDIVYDPSAGFGGRYLGAYCMNLQYIGTDPNITTHNNLLHVKDDLQDNRSAFYNLPSEELELNKNSIDFIFTSIPFFDTEVYCKEETQSYNRYKNIEDWKKNYLELTFKKCKTFIKQDKFIAININEKYKEIILECAKNAGLIFVKNEFIQISKSHFDKNKNSSNKKHQYLIYFQ